MCGGSDKAPVVKQAAPNPALPPLSSRYPNNLQAVQAEQATSDTQTTLGSSLGTGRQPAQGAV